MNRRSKPSIAAHAIGRRQIIAGAGAAFWGLALGSVKLPAADDGGLTHSAEAIHQEPVFQASRQRVYQALTDARQFQQVMLLSGVIQSMGAKAEPTELKTEAGSAFRLFGGYVVGRQIELVPDERIVQAWRSASWKAGYYSVVRFELVSQNAETRIVFDHRGFPDGTGEHLASGWKEHYWGPLAKYLAGQK
ncbi:MAG TPA: SRPBCC domain-containing protein [Bryobacteraceae bacterium]|nr:SRPBCC domain-containing protein [Bryobacteraceae bacterium]